MGTAPDDAASHLRLGLETDAQGNRLATFSPHHPGRLYRLQSRTDVESATWTTLTNLPLQASTPGKGVITDTNAPGAQRYYRLKVELVP